jgi:ABC-type glycerol-3-phosphate transport system permease component
MKTKKIKDKFGIALSYIFIFILTLVVLFPLGWIISTSVKPATEIFTTPPRWIPSHPTLMNYKDVFLHSNIPINFFNSLIVGLLSTLISLVLGGAAGYAFARMNFRGSKILSLFMLLSRMLPLIVLMIPIYFMMQNMGLIDTKIGLAIAHLILTLPLVTWMAKGYFKAIPKELEEAAMIDGCNRLQALTKIILPLTLPGIAATGVYAFVCSWNEFVLANVLTNSNISRTLPIGIREFAVLFRVNWGNTMAAAAIIAIPVIIVFFFLQKYFITGLAGGAIKG